MVNIYVILVKQEYMQSSTYSLQKVSNTHKEQSSPWRTLMLFLDMRIYKNWAHQISSWKYQTVLRLVLPVFPRAHNTSFLLSTLNSLQGYWKSAVIPAYDLILVEVDGKCQFVFDMINISFFFFKRVPCHSGTCMCLALVADLELQLCASPPCLLRNICQSIWISGQHFSGLHRGLRRLPTVLGLVCKQV